jgi:hypothetical protein
MQYAELEEHLTFFDNAAKAYEQYSHGNSENDMEYAGFISGDLHETHEILLYALSDSRENYDAVTKFLEEHCPNTFNIMIANLASRPDDYEALYDLCREINIRKEDNFEFPEDCLQKIKIYK